MSSLLESLLFPTIATPPPKVRKTKKRLVGTVDRRGSRADNDDLILSKMTKDKSLTIPEVVQLTGLSLGVVRNSFRRLAEIGAITCTRPYLQGSERRHGLWRKT